MRKNQNERYEEQPLTGRGQRDGARRTADSLKHHVAQNHPRSERKRHKLPAQGAGSHGYHLRIAFAEPRHHLGRINVAYNRTNREKHHSHTHAEPESLADPRINPRTIIIAAHRLESLPEAYHKRVDEHADTCHDRHAGDSGIAISSGGNIKQDSSHARQSLTAERRASAINNFLEKGSLRSEVPETDADVLAPAVHIEQNEETAHLPADCRPCSSGNAHAANKNQQRSKPDIQHGSRRNADHRIERIPLKAHLIVEHQRRSHKRRTQQDDSKISFGIGQNGGSGTELTADERKKRLAHSRNDAPHGKRAEKPRGRHLLGVLVVLRSQLARNVVSRPVPEEKTESLDDGHDRKRNTHGRSSLRVDFPHKIRVNHHIDRRNHHADDCRNGQRTDERRNRRSGHLGKLVLMLVFHHMEFSPANLGIFAEAKRPDGGDSYKLIY